MDTDAKTIELNAIVRKGIYFDYYSVADHPHLIAKVVPKVRPKTYFGLLSVNYPMSFYTRCKFRIADMAKHEFAIYQSLPTELTTFLPQQIHLAKTRSGATALCYQGIIDFDGRPSQFVYDLENVENAAFWRDIDTIVQILRDHRVCLFSIFKAGYTVAVQRLDREIWQPVLSDVHRCGKWMYYYRPHMLLDWWAWRKFENDYREFVNRYCVHRARHPERPILVTK